MTKRTKNFGAASPSLSVSAFPWIVPCPNSEIAACYHPSDLLKTQAFGTVLEKSTKNVGEKQGH